MVYLIDAASAICDDHVQQVHSMNDCSSCSELHAPINIWFTHISGPELSAARGMHLNALLRKIEARTSASDMVQTNLHGCSAAM